LPGTYATRMPHEPSGDHELAELFRDFAATTGSRAPLYADISEAIASDPRSHIRELLNNAPGPQRRPVLFLAAVHHLVLKHPNSPLAQRFPSVTGRAHQREARVADLLRDLNDFCREFSHDIAALVSTRHTQTNDVSRSAILRLALAHHPVTTDSALIDIGCSAGLNLHLDAYNCTYTAENRSWTAAAGNLNAPSLQCSVRATEQPSVEIGRFTRRTGFDPLPIDVHSEDASWLLACVWPDQLDRISRLNSAIDWAKRHPVDLRRADALSALDDVATFHDEHLTIINSWVLSYLSEGDQHAYRTRLEELGRHRNFTWVYLEQPSTTQALAHDKGLANDPKRSEHTAVTRIDWVDGSSHTHHLGIMHPHGYWFHPSSPAAT